MYQNLVMCMYVSVIIHYKLSGEKTVDDHHPVPSRNRYTILTVYHPPASLSPPLKASALRVSATRSVVLLSAAHTQTLTEL